MNAIRTAIDFTDTALAFRHKDDRKLKRTFRLFRMIDSPFLTRIGPPLITFALRIGLPVKGLIKKTIFDIFCGGETLAETVERSEMLFKNGVLTILDYSVEGEKTEDGFDRTANEIIATLQHGARHEAVAFSAMKVTGIARFELLQKIQEGKELDSDEQAELEAARGRLHMICKTAHELGQPVFIDAEESWIQDVIDHWAEEMMELFNQEEAIVYTTVQLYRHDKLAYLEELILKAKHQGYYLGVKLVRGAYMEKERDRAEELGYKSPIQKDKSATDNDFDAALMMCVKSINDVAICCGSHNEKSSGYLAELVLSENLPTNHPHVLFAQLLGMSDHISFNLAHHGFRTAKYLPYGPVRSVLPYLFRRANENTSIGGQSSREVQLLRTEVRRRKGIIQ